MVCLRGENRVVIHDLETGHQKDIDVKKPWKCSSSQHMLAISTYEDGLHVFTIDGILVHSVPDSMGAKCAAFHLRNTNILAIGLNDGSVRMWDVQKKAVVSSFKAHTDGISSILFESDCRLFLSSWDKTASIVTLDDQFKFVSSVKLEGHDEWVLDILPLSFSNKCVTCTFGGVINVWDCETGACLRTLTEHANWVTSLALHPNGLYFASGSDDRTVIVWSSETFEVLHRTSLPNTISSLIFVGGDLFYLGIREHGVMVCHAKTGGVGRTIIPGSGYIPSIAFGKLFT